ncbi:L-threonylcarbamoyladenylate synthase [Pararhodobacter aggregans]|uniref:Threonylcarbamoyl-AMP synthase n=1 Tax=Pararhodobacter aggregans TaxID=404875 RepID=A0A2T7UXJ5_9RHOB|nr:L-threonylcarbamoyladenylate synthase [Pararhodobacter aggregans]PTX05211.1 translation factor SUA5 [Pararhodobacter aggregans]PVE49510.1 threonylcarbamoyl-AMP synthase [Pararhodobacter aggregans]
MAETRLLPPDATGLRDAAGLLRDGKLVAFPTETVYGLGGDARDDQAVAGIFAAKGRPRFNPLIAHLPDLDQVERYARLTPLARRLAQAFWPGPLTLVLPLKGGLSPLVTAGLDTVAIRVPAHPVAQTLLQAFDGPLAAPSANPSGRISPVTARHVLEGLGGRIAAVVDGGDCAVGLESTILDATGEAPVLLRAGGLPVEAIEALGLKVTAREGGAITAPGQLASHYAPRGRVRLEATAPEPGEIWVGFGPCPGAALTLSATGDTTEAAARLFHALHEADALAGPEGRIAFAPLPETGLGRAINDRLRRAAAPR